MSTETFAGGTAYIASCGSKNPVAAMLAQAILSQNMSLPVTKAQEAGAQNVGTTTRTNDLGR